MVPCYKMISVAFLAALTVSICQAKCPEGDSAPISLSGSSMTEPEADDRVDPIPEPAQQVTSAHEATTQESCKSTSNRAVDAPKTEQVVVTRNGKKYNIITITLPIETDALEAATEEPTESTLVELAIPEENTPNTEAPIATVEDLPELDEPAEPKTEEKGNKKRVKVEKKQKYKRDVGKKSADKKFSKRKNQEQGKKKNKSNK